MGTIATTAQHARPADAADDSVAVYETPDAVEALAPAWDLLARTPMQHSIWARAWAETFTGSRLHVMTAGAPDAPAAIVPLVTGGRGPARLELLGAELYEPMDAIGTVPEALAEIALALAGAKMPLLLRRVYADSCFAASVREAYAGRGLVHTHPTRGAPYLPLDEAWAEPDGRFGSRRRSDIRRARRRAEALGDVEIEILTPSVDELGPRLDEIFRVEAMGWKGEKGTSLTADPLRAGFYRSYAEAAARRGILRLCFLRIGGKTAAVQLAVESHHRFWLLKIGYDEAFARCSPGTLLMLETVRHAAERGLEQYELLGAREPWTAVWTDLEHECVSVSTYPWGFSGLGALAADGAKLAGRRWRTRAHR